MEKRNRNAGHKYSLKDRILAWAMVFFVTITMIPYDSLVVHAASTTSVKDIDGIETEYEVDNGTSKGEIGLPDELSVVLETVTAAEGATNGESKVSEDTADKAVVWEGNYNGEKAGTYALTAKFKDKNLQYDDDDMPTVYVTVREPETSEPETTAEAENSEDEDEGEDDEESDQQAQSENQNDQQDEDQNDQQAVEQNDQQPEDQDDQQTVEQAEEQNKEQNNEQAEEQSEEEPQETEQKDEEQQPEEQTQEQTEPEVIVEEPVEESIEKDAMKSETLPPGDMANQYYGPNGSARTVEISIDKDKTTAKAGDDLTYIVSVQPYQAAQYAYDGTNGEPMFSTWDVEYIYIDLPDNVTITSASEEYVSSYELVDAATNKWKLNLVNPHLTAVGVTPSFDIDVVTHIQNNGILPDGYVLDDATAEIKVNFDVRIDIDDPNVTRPYSAEDDATTGPVTLSTPDEWTLTKSPYEAPNNYSIDTDAGTVTVHYLIKYGLSVNNVPSSDPNVYLRHGRVPFAANKGPKLEDVPTLTLYDGSTLTEQSITVTPAASGYEYLNGDSADDSTTHQPLPISMTRDEAKELPYALVGTNENDVAVKAPAFSEYKVDVVYDLDEFMVWYYENPDDTNALSHNVAKITCTLAGQRDPQEPEDDGDTTIPGYIPPAEITIKKYIVNYDSSNKKLYDQEVKAPVTGPATYKVFKADGTSAATLYYKDENDDYQPISGNTLTINPGAAASATNGAEGSISVYLDAGTYVIKETGAPSNTEIQGNVQQTLTVNENHNVDAEFNNKEKLGQIKINKVDDTANHSPVSGAVFGLYSDSEFQNPVLDGEGQPIQATSKSSGEALFSRLVPGTYYVKEESAPATVIILNPNVGEVTVTANNTTAAAITVENHVNGTFIELEKLYSTVTNPTNFIPVTNDYTKFADKFMLQKSTDGGSTWTDVGTFGIDDDGKNSAIPVNEYENGTPVMYRFVETIPSGYFNESGTTDPVTSVAITPANGEKKITMKNMQGGIINLTKYKMYNSTSNPTKYSTSADGSKTFRLYYTLPGSDEAVYVKQATTNSSGKLTFSGLPAATDGQIRTYYVVETNVASGYQWQTDSTIKVDGTDTPALKIGSFTETTGSTISANTYNITDYIPIKIRKKDSITGNRLANAVIQIGSSRTIKTSATADVTSYIRPGYQYVIKENSVPAGYYLDAQQYTLDTRGWTVKRVGSNQAKYYKADGTEVTAADLTFEFLDTPLPKVSVQKKVKAEGQTDEQAKEYKDATFKFYVKNEDGTFSTYQRVSGTDVSVKADGTSIVYVTDGTYYLHEEISGVTNVLNPDLDYTLHPEHYEGKGEYKDGKFYFGPYTVNKPSATVPVNQMLPGSDLFIMNYSNVANLTVEKELYDEYGQRVAPASENGFMMYLYRTDADGSHLTQIGNAIATGSETTEGTAVNGQATFENLPVYDAQGNKYLYYVREVLSAEQQKLFEMGHTVDGDTPGQTAPSVNLTPGETTDAGIITNFKKPSVIATKKYIDMRENQLMGTVYNLEGARIALYGNNGDGTYTYLRITGTNSSGQALYTELPYYADGYVAVEVSIPDKPEYTYMIPGDATTGPKELLGTPPETLTQTELETYNYVTLTKDTDPKYSGTLWNQIPWTQIHITKWGKHADSPDSAYIKINGTTFTLYKQVLSAGTDGGELSFSESNCSVVGTYSSGTWILNGEMQTGELQTAVLDNAENIVYWLVETRPSTGYGPLPGDEIILFHMEGTNYTNKSESVYGNQCTRTAVLYNNKINEEDVHNIWDGGPGPHEGVENNAYILFSKWRETADNTYEMMPNATFQLWAVTSSGDRVKLLDTITTGEENPMIPEYVTTGHGVSHSIDAWDLYAWLEENYTADEIAEIMTFQATDPLQDVEDTYPYYEDGSGTKHPRPGTFWLNAALIEVGGPSLYELDTHYHNLQITFLSGGGCGNDKYFVTDINGYSHCDNTDDINNFNNTQHVAIVDHLAQNHPVTFRHFGYDPAVVGKNLMHDDLEDRLDENGANFKDVEVTFKLLKFNPHAEEGTDPWENWVFNPSGDNPQGASANDQTFSASGNGYSFPDGLVAGQYKVIMVGPATGYENFYPDATPFYFNVTASDKVQVFTTFSPERPDLKIEKVDFNNNVLTAPATFTLTNVGGQYYSDTQPTENGVAVFKDIPADTKLKLNETAAPEGYTERYFVDLFKQDYYPAYSDFVGTGGYMIGYETDQIENGGTDPATSQPTKETVIKDNQYLANFKLSVRNAERVDLKLKKIDAQAIPEVTLDGAIFSVFFKPFDKVSGEYTVPTYAPTDTSWSMIGDEHITADGGTVLIEDLEPGVYYVQETDPPSGYDLNPNGQTIVITGGMNLTIADSEDYTVYRGIGGEADLTFEDMPKTGLKVFKEVEFGDFPATNYEFTFQLKDSHGQTIAGNPEKATGTATDGVITSTTYAEFKELSQGEDYYLKENAVTGFKIKNVKIDGQEINPETSGDFKDYYKIHMPDDGTGVSVTVTNTYMAAKVTIFKYDGETDAGLSGATFTVITDKDNPDTSTVSRADITDNGDGTYTIIIPMTSFDGVTYYIHEVTAPASQIQGKDYVIDELLRDIAVPDLKPGDVRNYKFDGHEAQDNEYVLPNFIGAHIEVTKYGGLEGNASTEPLEGAQLQLYFSNDGGNHWNSWHKAETTDGNGSANFLIREGYTYAIAETNDVEGFVGLHDVYCNGAKLTTTTFEGLTLFIMGDEFVSGQTFTYTANNLPYLELEVNKEDLSEPAVTNPNADFHVYEVPNGTPKTLTRAQIKALIQQNEDEHLDELESYTTNSTYTNNNFIMPGKTYLAIEDKANDPDSSSQDDYSIILDDSRVVSYEVFDVPLENYEPKYTVTFKNIKGIPTIGIEKDVEQTSIDSLIGKPAELNYTIKPQSTNTVALDSYTLNDSGLRVVPATATLAEEWYNITEVTVGQGLMDKYLVGADPSKDYDIYATVTFVGFDGTEYPQESVNVTAGNIQVLNTTGKNIKSFYIDYKSDDLWDDTHYALGQNFEAKETTFKVTVFEQTTPESGSIVAVKEIYNDADVTLYYSPWSSTGVKQTSTDLHANDDAKTVVDAVPAPKIQFDKTGPDSSVAIEIGEPIEYTLTVTNVSDEEVDLTNPIVVDLLPKGMVIDTNQTYLTVESKPDTINDNHSVTIGSAGESQYVKVDFTGTVAKNEAIVIKLKAYTTAAVTNYGRTMTNYAFTTSKEVGVITSENAAGAVIRDPEGAWAVELVEAARSVNCEDELANALKNALGEIGTHGFLADQWTNNWKTTASIVGVKAEYGPQDNQVYSTTRVSVLFNDEDIEQRTMHYQLTVNNTSVQKRTNLVVMDIMPVVGDQRLNGTDRLSQWPLYFDQMGPVTVNGETTTNYTLYYYTGDASQFTDSDIESIVRAAQSGCPTGWTTGTPTPGEATAIIIAFAYDPNEVTAVTNEKTVVIEPGESLQIEFTATTPHRDPEPLNEIVFTNAANDFNYGFQTFAATTTADLAHGPTVRDSNVVEVTIAPPEVKVGGDVWIDADDDGFQNDGDQTWFLEFDIVKQLIQDLSVSLTTSNQKDQTPSGTTAGTITQTGNDTEGDPLYGIAHFEFDHLLAAKIRDGGTNYDTWTVNQLVGKNPYTYFMDMEYSGSTFQKTTNEVDPRGSYPPSNIPTEDQTDDNFEAATGTTGAYRTEWFFLHQTTDIFDMSKDIGWNIKRELTLTKTAKSNGRPIQGAKFKVYGWFEPGEGSTASLVDEGTNKNLVGEFTTNAQGKIVVPNLQFFKEYVIVESQAGTGFSIDGATGTGVNIEELDTGKWLLKVPSTKQTTVDETMGVQDPELIEVAVEKVWNDNNDEYGDRPTSIKVDLYTNEACTTKAVDVNGDEVDTKTLNAQNNWKATWTNLPRYDGSDVITYYVKETDAQGRELASYNAQIVSTVDSKTGNVSFTITNTPEYVKLEVTKEFESDVENPSQYVKSITFKVQRSTDGNTWTDVAGKTAVVTRATDGSYPTASVNGLPKADADGNEYTYRAVEVSMVLEKDGQEETITFDEQNSTIGGYTVDPGTPEEGEELFAQTVINTLESGKLKVKKVWDDNNNQDGKRPVSILIHITADTTYYHFSQNVTLNEANNWTSPEYTVPVKDAKGTDIEYHIEEDDVDDYDTSYSADGVKVVADQTTEVTVTNTYKPTPTKKEARKEWNDNNNAYLTRPESIEFTLYATWTDDDGNDHEYVIKKDLDGNDLTNPATVTANENWATKWENLPEYQPGEQGKELTYEVRETAVTGHTTTYAYDGDLTIVYNTPIPTSLEVSKEFVGEGQVQGDGRYGQYIQTVTFKVQRSTDGSTWEDVEKNETAVTLKVTRKPDGTCTTDSVNDLPKYAADGTEYQYRAVEVSMTLVKDGEEETVLFDENGNVIGGYDVTAGDVEAEDEGGYTQNFTNTLNPGTLQVKKVWDDNNNQDGKRPVSVTITVSAKTKYFTYKKVLTLNEANNWTSEVLTVPVCDEGGNKITYNIKETGVPNYETTYAASDDVNVSVDELTTVTVTNKYTPTPTSIDAIKDWDDLNDPYEERPSSIVFTLKATWTDDQGQAHTYDIVKDLDGNDLTNPVTVTAAESWKTKWENLPEYQPGEQGKELTYSVVETKINGFVTTYDHEGNVWTIKNTPNTKTLHVKKTWSDEILGVGNYVKSVTFTVQKSIKDEDSWSDVTYNGSPKTVTIEREGNAFVEKDVTGLPECDSSGNYLEYRAVETSMVIEKDGSEVEVQINNGVIGGYNVTEDHEAENLSDIKNSLIKGKLKVVKVWDDDDDRDGYRPEKLEVKITAKTDYFEYEKTITLKEENHWGNDLDPIELPVMDEAGNKITYTIVEETVEHYTEIAPTYVITAEGVDTVDGTGVTSNTELTENVVTNDEYTNHHKPEVTNAVGKKIWNDQNNLYGERPETITFELWRRYAEGPNLPAFKEEAVTEDEDGNPITPLEVTEGADHTWSVEWTNLPVYKKGLKGVRITYYVKETHINGIPVDEFYGYIIDENGMTVTNTPKETSLKIEKTWAEDLPCIANTVSAVTFQVEKSTDGNSWENVTTDGTPLKITLPRNGGGTFGQAEVLGLPAYNEDSEPYTYRAVEISITVNGTEVPVSGSQVGGYAITETHTPGEDESIENAVAQDLSQITNTLIRGDLAVEKEWTDNDDNNGARSTSLKITLKAEANGVEITGIPTSTVLSASNDWKDYTTWKNVPVYDAAGNNIDYTFTEPTTGDYRAYVTVTSEEEGNTGTTTINPDSVTKIKFRNELILTEFDVVKEFGEDPTGIINSKVKSIKVKIQRSLDDGQTWGEVIRKDGTNIVDLTEDNGWRYRWDDLPRYDSNGTLIQYRAIEVSITTVDDNTYNVTYGNDETSGVVTAYNYTSITTPAGDEPPAHTTLINTIIIGKLKAIKHWDDDNDRDNLRPEDITFHLFQNGVKLGTDWDRFLDGQKAVSENDDENFVLWEQLPVFDIDGKEIEYAYSETMGSSGSGDSGDSGSEGGSGTEGGENPLDKAARLIRNTVKKLRGDLEDTGEPTEGGEGGENEGGEPVGDTYEVIEDSNGDYTAEIDLTPATLIENETVTTTITNKHIPLTTQMYVKKVWVGNFIYGDHPESVDVYLYATYETGDSAEPTDPVAPTEPEDQRNADEQTDPAEQTTSGTVTELAAPEHEGTPFSNPATLSADNNWEYTWIDLPVYKTGYVGHKITYSVEEKPVPNGFEVEYAEEEELLETVGSVDVMTTNFTVTNTMKTTNLEVDKTWIDEDEWIADKIKSVSFKVQRSIDDGTTWQDLINTETGEVVTLTILKQDSVATIDELPTFSANGYEYKYRAAEIGYTLKTGEFIEVVYDENTETSGKVGAYNYVSSTEGNNEDGYVTQVENPQIKTSLVVMKKWMGDSDNNRPKSLKVTLKTFAGDKEITLKSIPYSTELNGANGWKDEITWAFVPVYDEYGNKIIYMLEEPAIARYSASYEITSGGNVLESGNGTACSTDVFEGAATEVTFKNYYHHETTGDNAPIAAAGGAFAVGLAGLAAVLARKKKRSN